MKKLLTLFVLLLGSFFALGESPHLVVAFAPPVPDQYRQELATGVGNLLFKSEPGTRITLLDAVQMSTVIDVTVPSGPLRVRQQKLTSEIVRVVRTLRGATNVGSPFNAPRLLDHVGLQLRSPGSPLSLLLIAPSRYRNPKEPAFDMSTRWPSDGHLSAGGNRSVFSTVERAHQLDQVSVEWLVTDMEEFSNQGHAEGATRFWALYIATQGGRLEGFSPDFRNAFLGVTGTRRANRPVPDLSPADRELAMHSRTIRAAPAPVVAATNAVSEIPAPPPGKTGLAIIWDSRPGEDGPVDLDLHVQPPGGGPEIYFGHPTTPYGRLFRDIRQSLPTSNGPWRSSWEYVEVEGETLPNEVWINLYSGRGPIRGILRTFCRGRELDIAFELPAGLGDRASEGSRRAASPQWVRIGLSLSSEEVAP